MAGGVTWQCPIIPNPSGTPESFMDTPVVNGKAYPVLHVSPEAYRFKILSAGNDRSWNLSWFVADATQGNTEVAMVSEGGLLPAPIVIPATRLRARNLAKWPGTTLFTVSRLLSKWSDMGLVYTENRGIVLEDLDGLLAIADARGTPTN
jgi:hypothetical protein